MRHEDFTSLDIADVLRTLTTFAREASDARSVHWISAYGLARVHESVPENWAYAFAAADLVNQHMWSEPPVDTQELYRMWKMVDGLLGQGVTAKKKTPHMVPGATARFVYPFYNADQFLGVLVFEQPQELNPVRLLEQVRAGLEVASKYVAFAYQHLEARNESYRDELTGLYNQRFLPLVLEHEIGRAKRDGVPFTLLFLDIDYFKMVNDGRGHLVGSRLLVELGKVLRGQVRANDYCFRYGGDEFIVLLGNASPKDSQGVAERIRKAVEQKTFTVEGHNLNLTVSIGLAAYPQHAQSASGLIQIADQAMYYGKRKSRNIVFVAS